MTIVNVPWNRALLMVNAGTANGILGLEKSSSPNLIYPASAVAKYSVVVFSLASNNWRYSGVESLKNVRLGLIQGTGDGDDPDFANYLKSNPANVTYLATNDTLLHLFKMIEAHHIDATIDDQFAGNYLLEKSGKKNLYKTAPFHQNDTRGYVGVTPKDPKSRHLADVFDAGMARLRKSGKLKSIVAAYGMTDWQK